MLRRNARLRREYLYRKSLEGKERTEYERKRAIREALAGGETRGREATRRRRRPRSPPTAARPRGPPRAPPCPTPEGKPIPTDLRRDEAALRRQVALEDDSTAVPRTHADDEYGRAAEREPKVLVTTSRDPSSRLTAFSKEVRLVIPNATRVNRGGQVVADLVASARAHDFTDIVVLHEHRGEPDGLVICHLPHGPTASFGVHNAVLRHDLGDKKAVGTLSEAYPHLVFDNFTSALGARVKTVLTHLFPPPKPDAKRIITFANRADHISFRHHTFAAPRGPASAALTEVGPRFELRLYQIKLGTLDNAAAEDEWALRAYVRSAKKSKLSEDGAAAGAADFRMAARAAAPRKRKGREE